MKKTVKSAIERIARRVKRETGVDITDFLYDTAENYEYDEDGNKATCRYIINGLENEADNYIDFKNRCNPFKIPYIRKTRSKS